MGVVSLLLSSRERKALFRAIYWVDENQGLTFYREGRRDELMDELDDGGIWNPCILRVPARDMEKKMVIYYLVSGINADVYEHELEMIKERLKYVDNQPDSSSRNARWPFLTSGGYYGTDWEERRQEVIRRDRFKCADCGLTRNSQQDIYGHDLHAHHIKPKSEWDSLEEANSPDNLMTLCFDCHMSRNPGFSSEN